MDSLRPSIDNPEECESGRIGSTGNAVTSQGVRGFKSHLFRHIMNAISWATFVAGQPRLAASIAHCFTAHPHHVLATLRKDGSPRLSGTNVFFTDELRIGSMPRARKIDDLRRDPRCALHSAPIDEELKGGDAKLDCVAREMSKADTKGWLATTGHPTGDGVGFVLHVIGATLTRVTDGSLIVETWSPSFGARTIMR